MYDDDPCDEWPCLPFWLQYANDRCATILLHASRSIYANGGLLKATPKPMQIVNRDIEHVVPRQYREHHRRRFPLPR